MAADTPSENRSKGVDEATAGKPEDPSSASHALREEMWQVLLGRMSHTYQASRRETTDNTAWMEERLQFIAERARLFFRYHIPAWPPKMLLRKILRRLLLPILMPQADINEAVRDVLIEMRFREDRQAAALQEASSRADYLEERVAELTHQVEMLTRLVKSTPETRYLQQTAGTGSGEEVIRIGAANGVGTGRH